MSFAQATIAGKFSDITSVNENTVMLLLTNEKIEVPLMVMVYGKMAERLIEASKDPEKQIYGIATGRLEVEDGQVKLQSRSIVPSPGIISFSSVSIVGNLGQDVEVKVSILDRPEGQSLLRPF